MRAGSAGRGIRSRGHVDLADLGAALLALLVLAGWLTPACAADLDLSNYYPTCDGKFGLCGFVDAKTRQELIPARFESVAPFSEGLAGVLINGRFGYIDARGEIVIAPSFQIGGPFNLGLAEVVVDGKAGVIDRTGQIIVPLRFSRAVPLTGAAAAMRSA